MVCGGGGRCGLPEKLASTAQAETFAKPPSAAHFCVVRLCPMGTARSLAYLYDMSFPRGFLRSRSLRCYALNCIHIWGVCKGLRRIIA
ncbi:hypothetical protein HMPREF9371_1187 [Neisseria shayeganii 871]|uniref:Uncharacterized protein n=1 Tax=Neisseria shayeganii 871 TaxID=1032488 RepID=G4CHU8_9NEIS|nr:hypothetical protein HMPREF9371_1187 [Neisseria shayeganii 871]